MAEEAVVDIHHQADMVVAALPLRLSSIEVGFYKHEEFFFPSIITIIQEVAATAEVEAVLVRASVVPRWASALEC